MSFFLNKIGIYDKLFHLLWYKPEFLKTSGLNLNIPDTILFDKGQPLFWYYSNSSGRIMKKKSVLLNEIIDKFNEFPNKSGVLAYFISEVSFDEFHRPSINNQEMKYIIKYSKSA